MTMNPHEAAKKEEASESAEERAKRVASQWIRDDSAAAPAPAQPKVRASEVHHAMLSGTFPFLCTAVCKALLQSASRDHHVVPEDSQPLQILKFSRRPDAGRRKTGISSCRKWLRTAQRSQQETQWRLLQRCRTRSLLQQV